MAARLGRLPAALLAATGCPSGLRRKADTPPALAAEPAVGDQPRRPSRRLPPLLRKCSIGSATCFTVSNASTVEPRGSPSIGHRSSSEAGHVEYRAAALEEPGSAVVNAAVLDQVIVVVFSRRKPSRRGNPCR